jgi:hypothetical protein
MEQIVYRNLILLLHHLHLPNLFQVVALEHDMDAVLIVQYLNLTNKAQIVLKLFLAVALERDMDAVLIVQYLNLTNKAQIVIKIYDYV